MPILDPILQFKLVHQEQKSRPKSKYQFAKNYLDIASKNIYRSNETIKAYIQFKKDLNNNFESIKDYFNFNDKNDVKQLKVPDLYKYILDFIKEKGENTVNDGDFYEFRSISSNFNFYQPYVDYDYQHSWFLCNSPIAVLCLRLDKLKDKHIGLITFETDLMIASGYTLVLCIAGLERSFDFNTSFFGYFIENHNFAEIHINYNTSYVNILENSNCYYKMLETIRNNYHKYDSYFYLYSQHLNKNSSESNKLSEIYKKLKKMPRFNLICFGDNLDESFKEYENNKLQSCYYCKDGFENDRLKIILCDVPVYESDDDIHNLVPNTFAKCDMTNSVVYLKKDDFLYWIKERVQIGENQFVDFNDIHYVNPDLFVKHTMYLGKVDYFEMRTINKIIGKTTAKYRDKQYSNFRKEFFLTLFTDKKAKKLLSYVLYAYKMSHPKFQFLKSQVYVAYKAIDFCIQHRFSINNSGFVYEVSTGEGKSSIVILIAAVLALFGRTVHVVTSNIILANRDYNDSCEFFAQLDLISAALVHQNEIPPFDDVFKEYNYPGEYFGEDCFKNPMGMNFITCGVSSDKGKADIIFSTLINFESMYLYMTEKYPGRISKYYKNCSLVIDEADLILIDELTNGTILSRSMKSNSEEILSYIYDCRCKSKNITAAQIHSTIKEKWPECNDIKPKDIEIMFQEIDLVNEDEEFVAEKKYSLVDIKTDDEGKKKSKIIQKEVIPFNYDHTGILEPNKEFGGFIQQFIALKERKTKKNLQPNENLVVKEVSMNYLYISHPIYVSFYNNVCGLTGTIGKKADKEIFRKHYHLQTKRVPKENPNRRYEFPIILCTSEKERNEQIVKEIMAFHMKGNPVLAIFLSPTDIDEVKKGIESHEDFQKSKVDIGVYDGKNEKIKPDKNAGSEGAISLGTNVCGRGTHIDVGKKSLHVIVTFFSTNTRAMNQAFGRTARQENFGTVRTICLLKEFLSEMKEMNNDDIDKSLGMLSGVNEMQNSFIDYYRETRKWIFDIHIKEQKLLNDDIREMRSVLINANRINAYNFRFPLCMKYKTFLDIQAQKIFSLYNCPNSKYTWRLFQQYIREMILESWSLVLNRAERNYNNFSDERKRSISYNEYLKEKKYKLIDYLKKYLPEEKNKIDIVPTFMHIFREVVQKYSTTILSIYKEMMPNNNTEEDKTNIKPKMSMIKIGFRPFTLSFKSGSKIYNLLNDGPKILYIEDPELKYQRKGSKFCSITEKIDNIFETICNFFGKLIGDKIGFKFFLRRTLGGCEFGLCYDFDIECNDEEIKKLKNCLIDKDPLFVFSICVKSMVPFLAGVLMFFLLYLANIARQMATFIQQIPKLSAKVVKKVAISIAKLVAEKAFEKAEDKIIGKLCDFLKDLLNSQICKFKFARRNYYLLFRMLCELLIDKVPDAEEKIFEGFSSKIKINTKSTLGKVAANGMEHVFKIGFLLVLCAASFLINFQIDKSIKYSNTKVASQLTKGNNYKDKDIVTNYVENNEKIFDKQIKKIE